MKGMLGAFMMAVIRWSVSVALRRITIDVISRSPQALSIERFSRVTFAPLLTVSGWLVVAVAASTFLVPVISNYTISQSYNNHASAGYHTGIDYKSDSSNVRAAAPGIIRLVQVNGQGCSCNGKGCGCQDHGLGNAVIVEHSLADGSTVFSLYGHLASFANGISSGVCLAAQAPIGIMGGSGYGLSNYWATHLHFEIKSSARLGNPIGAESYWGYTPGSATNYGYFAPNSYFGNVQVNDCGSSCSIAVGTGGGSSVQRFIDAYNRNGGQAVLGCPTNSVHTWGNGTIQDLSGGSGTKSGLMLANGASTAWALYGPMWAKYEAIGGVNHGLGYPIGDVSGTSTASTNTQLSYQQFQDGALEWHRSGDRSGQVFEVHGAIYRKWRDIGHAAWWGGMPTSDEKDAPRSPQGRTGRVSDFERGHIWWISGATAAYETHGDIDGRYMSQNGPSSCLGFPTTDEFVNSSGRAQNNFENGYITTTDGQTYQVFCGGTSTRLISLTGDLAFGNVAVGATANRTLSIANGGNASLAVSNINYPTGFSGNWSSGAIPAGESRGVTITFAPTAAATYGGSITVDANYTNGTNTIAVSGTGTSSKAEMTTPAPGSTLTSSTVTFQWTGGIGVSKYWLYVGSGVGEDDLYDVDRGTNLSATVSDLPTDGGRVYARLWSLIGSKWQYNDYTYTATTIATAKAELTTPAPGSTLTASTVTFQWTGGTGVSRYWLYLGTAVGRYDVYNVDRGTNLSATVSSLPTDGSRIYSRLWFLIGSNWQYNDYTYTATTVATAKAELTSPAPGSTLTSSTVTFQWTGGTGVSQYWLYLGTAEGRRDVYNDDRGSNLTTTVSNLPTDGSRIYARLWSLIGSKWQYNDYTYTAAAIVPTKAEMTIPAPGATLTASTVTFQWTGGMSVSRYWLYIGTEVGGYDLYNVDRGSNLNATVSDLPTDGNRVYARLWSLIGSKWQYNDYTYTATTIATAKAELTTPAPGSTLTASTVTFQWTGGTGVSRYWLYLGTAVGQYDVYNVDRGTNLSATVSSLPTDGSRVYARLWSLIGSNWQYNDYTYTATTIGTATAEMTTPPPGSTLTSSTVTFQWTGGIGVSQYWLYLGTAVGRYDIYNVDRGSNLNATVSDLPTDGSRVYARLWSLIGSKWQYNDYTYTATAITTAKAEMTAPAPGSTLTSSTVTFQWTGGIAVSQYWLYLGSAEGRRDVYDDDRGSNLSAIVSNLPTDGSRVYARLWSLIGSKWRYNDYTYTAATILPTKAEMTTPSPGSTLTASTVTFQWTGGIGVSQYWLYVGLHIGGYNLYNVDRGTNLSATVTNLPANGGRVYARLWSLIGSEWEYNDYTYTAVGAVQPAMQHPIVGMKMEYTGCSTPSPETYKYSVVWTGSYADGVVCEGAGTHSGVDIPLPPETPIYSVADGEVVVVRRTGCRWTTSGCSGTPAAGVHVIVKHLVTPRAAGAATLVVYASYWHLTEGSIPAHFVNGVRVAKGDFIGKSGNTGDTRGPTGQHLHFQIDKDDGGEHPLNYYTASKTHSPVKFIKDHEADIVK